ncbi:LacI family DNA-binding transcriptional regulator, partial [Bacillus velezensis]
MLQQGSDSRPARRKDVAERAGVSPAVVSYVLNGGPRSVSAAVRERVLEAVAELGYRPNSIARSLRMDRTMTLGLIVPDPSNPFFATLVHAVLRHASAEGYALLIGDALQDGTMQETWIRTFIQRQVDGIILVPGITTTAGEDELRRRNVPLVHVVRPPAQSSDAPLVTIDNRAGAREATLHLIGHGRRSLACIAGPGIVRSARSRVEGWRDAMLENGVPVDEDRIVYAPFGREAGYRETIRLLERDGAPDAIFCGSDTQALGVLEALKDRGVRCPEDIAVVSFDGIPAAGYVTPGLTTMAPPIAEIGRTGVERLLELLKDPGRLAPTTVLPAQMVRRGSCGCPEP